MKFIIDNQTTKAVIGGKDLLHGNLKSELKEYLVAKIPNKVHIQRHFASKGQRFEFKGIHHYMNDEGVFATGFLPLAVDFMSQYPIDIQVEDIRRNLPIFKREGYHTKTSEFDLYEHQTELVKSVNNTLQVGESNVYFPRGIWKAATNSGKTAAAMCLIKSVVNPKCLFLVDSQELFEQHIEDFEKEFDKVGRIGKVFSPTNKSGKYVYEPEEMITIAMVDTLANRIKNNVALRAKLGTDYNIVVGDECHDLASGNAATVLQAVNAGVRILMSGTPLDASDRLKSMNLIGMSGSILHTISKRFLIDNGFSMEPIVQIYENPETRTGVSFDDEFEKVITRSEKRAELIADLMAKRTKRKILITFFEIQHGFLMYDTFITKYPHLADRTAWVHGQDPLRPQKIADYKAGKIQFLFTSSIMKQGINIKDIQTIINASAGKGTIALSQFMGRGERLDGINKVFEWVDFWDSGKYSAAHSLKRIRFYRNEELEVRFKYAATKLGRPKA